MAIYHENRDNQNVLVGHTLTATSTQFGLHDSRERRKFNEWVAQGGVADPDPNVLDKVKDLKREEYLVEAQARVKARVSEWDTRNKINFVASIWNMLGTPNANQTAAKDIYLYAKNTAIPNVNSQGTVAAVQAIDVQSDPSFPS
jgi:hypothetical protein|tara:strand:- start:229 stop:660 length:432 start_codon:yes stop_codon:yes gene_type:complete